jgi:hypothetical protein
VLQTCSSSEAARLDVSRIMLAHFQHLVGCLLLQQTARNTSNNLYTESAEIMTEQALSLSVSFSLSKCPLSLKCALLRCLPCCFAIDSTARNSSNKLQQALSNVSTLAVNFTKLEAF